MNPYLKLAIVIVIYLALGWKVLLTAVKNILKGDVFDENFLMTVATIGALCVGEYEEAVLVMLLYRVGEFLQDKAVGMFRSVPSYSSSRARRSPWTAWCCRVIPA